MKLKLEKLFFGSVIFQIIASQGLLLFIIFNFFGNWEIKQFLHPLSFVFVVVVFILKAFRKFTISIFDIVFFAYFLFLFVFFLINVDSLQSAYVVFREVYFIFILSFIYHQVEISQENWEKVLNLIFYLLIFNSIFILLTYYFGPEKYMKLITGRYQWGVDPVYKFKMTNFGQFWRSPALIGDAASVGYFSFFAYFFMDQNSKFKKKKYLALFPLFFSFIRSVYLVFIVYEFLKFFTQKKNLKILILVFKIGVPILLIAVLFLSRYEIFSAASLLDRFHLWSNEIHVEYNLLYGGSIGNVGGGARDQGFIGTIDSYWLFMLFSSGILGILLTLLFVFEKRKKGNKFTFILIAFFLAGFFVSLTQSIIFLIFFPFLFITIKENLPDVK